MNNFLLQYAIKMNKNSRHRRHWQKIVECLVVVVVFCTTYALILPAITMTKETICGIEAHEHSDACYEERVIYDLNCCLEQQEGEEILHVHQRECFDINNELRCLLEERSGYDMEEHVHDESCYRTVYDSDNMELASDSDSLMSSELASPSDVTAIKVLDCSYEEPVYHEHRDDCLTDSGMRVNVLTCKLEEHKHEESCYPKTRVSTPSDAWELTGEWPTDLLMVAESQLYYGESEENVILVEEEQKGYTVYGDTYDDPYADWNTLFANYCIEKAEITEFPINQDPVLWIEELKEAELYRNADYIPKPGDLVFLDSDLELEDDVEITPVVDMVGIVKEYISAPADFADELQMIAGDINDIVDYAEFEIGDPKILGYAEMPLKAPEKPAEPVIRQMAYSGSDYAVTVTFGPEAEIPENAELTVREIEKGSEEYDYYYHQSLTALTENRPEFYTAEDDESEEEPIDPVLFARFFDISFIVDGEKIEPSDSVEVQIKYHEAIEVSEENEAAAVHFSEQGIEILDTEMDHSEDALVDGFTFKQNSFSVTGTVVMQIAERAAVKGKYAATFVPVSQVDSSGNTSYIMYTEYNGRYYAITSKSNDRFGYAMEVYVNEDGIVSWNNDGNDMLWKITNNGNHANSYFVQNQGTGRYLHAFHNSTSDYGTATSGKYSSVFESESGGGFKAIGNNYYTVINNQNGNLTFSSVSGRANGSKLYLAKYDSHIVWLDGTLGGLMSYTNAPNIGFSSGSVFTLPETWGDEDNDDDASPMKYDYTLRGWYDIKSDTYYPVDLTDGVDGITVPITQDTVFYADWVPTSYSIGQNNEHVVPTLDTSEFVTIDLFDYNMLFNIMSASHTGSVSGDSHKETWSETSGKFNRYWGKGEEVLTNFYFRDWDTQGELSYPNGGKDPNASWDKLLENILDDNNVLIDILFNKNKEVLGKNYVGSANHLFQYMNDPNDKYYGYYYYDSERNAASYYRDEENPSGSRFYVYDYQEKTSDSGTADGADFLPFNSPYANNNGYEVPQDSSTGMYVYNAKGENQVPTTNFNFGMVTNIHFYLPNDVGHKDEYGNPGNLDTSGKEMIFRFDGDDDVWVFVDGNLVLDIGGIHGVESGTINFSTGEVINSAGQKESIAAVRDANGTLESGIDEGGHNLTIYYLERGSSLSNCCIYFNLAPRYALELQKKDYHTRENLVGVGFDVFSTCPNCAAEHCEIGSDGHCTLLDCNCQLLGGLSEPVVPAKLWNDHDEAKADPNDENTTNHFVVGENGLHMFGLVAGKTYYIKESDPLDGYPGSDDLIRVTLNDHGTEVSEVTILNGRDGVRSQGYEIVKHTLDETKRLLYMVLTNQREIPEGEVTKQVRVTKNWVLDEENPALIPDSITVHLTKDEKPYGHPMVLSAKNGWTYTWTGLPADGSVYDVREDQVPGFTLLAPMMRLALEEEPEYEIHWLKVAVLEDRVTFLLKNHQGYISRNGNSLTLVQLPDDIDDTFVPPEEAKWEVEAYEEGFKIGCDELYLTLDGGRFKLSTEGNQVLYYDGAGIFAMSGGQRYYLGSVSNGTSSAATTVQTVGLVKEEKIPIDVFEVSLVNYQLNEEDMTFVEVNKVWSNTSEAVWEKEVTIHLLADGKDTGQKLVLNQSNGWTGRFEGLSKGVSYNVLEETIPKYSADYSEVIEVPGGEVLALEETGSLGEYGTYCFINGSNAIASYYQNGSLKLGGTTFNKESPHNNQQWKYFNGKLQNMDTQQYLVLKRSGFSYSLSQISNVNDASQVHLEDGKLRIYFNSNTSRYLTLSGITVGSASSGTKLTVYQGVTKKIPTSYKVTVTNTYGAYVLPETGGKGTYMYTFGGLLLIAASTLMYIKKRGNRWRKGESR